MSNQLITAMRYWLVDHPKVSNFEWKKGITIGASFQFLFLTISTYLFSIYILSNYVYIIFPPLNPKLLQRISITHNALLIFLSITMATGGVMSVVFQMPNPGWIICFPANQTPPRGPVFFWGYVFYLSKVLEFTDTLLIIVSGNLRRLSFLHVFHHSVVLIMCYLWLDTSQTLFPVGLVVNSTVHVVMYVYYLMCTLGIRPTWKRMVTNCQIIQFVFGFVMFAVSVCHHLFRAPCSGLWPGLCLTAVFNFSLLYLFMDFRSKNYNDKRKMVYVDGGITRKML